MSVLRFAPSPTGYLHVGNARMALINWLYARKTAGTFILRLDDTDPERSREEYAAAIREDLTWLGLGWDRLEKQSDRLSRYAEAAESLRDKGLLYPCYETPDELELKRKVQLSRGKPPVYDRAALELSEAEKKAFEDEGRARHWRFRLSGEKASWQDGVRGPVEFETASLSDPILIRGDGSLLYTLPSVVDDLDFAVTHVFRGEDHVANTAAQIEIYRALGGLVPEFAHFALLTGASGEGLSKREGSLALRDLRRDGFEPMALNSLLARLGTADPVEAVMDLDHLVDGFDLSRFGRAAAKFDEAELERINAALVHDMEFAQIRDRVSGISETLWNAVRGNITRVTEVENWRRIAEEPITPVIEGPDFLAEAASLLPDAPWDEQTWSAWTTTLKEATGRKGKQLFLPLRQALTGLDHGPEMKHFLPLIGPERAKARLSGATA